MSTEERLAQSLRIPFTIAQDVIGPYSINYFKAGSGKPLLLIHGANIGWGQWYPNIPELAKHFEVFALDLPGAGRSTRVNYATLDPQKDLVEVVEAFTRIHDLKEVTIIGASIGGWLALKMALLHPDRVSRLVVVNSVGFADYMGMGDKVIGFYPLAKLISKTILKPGGNNKRIESFLRHTFYNRTIHLPTEFLEYFFETMMSSHNILFISRLTKLNKEFVLIDELPQIQQKTLVVWGEADAIMPLKRSVIHFNQLNNVEVHSIPETGHMLTIEKSDAFNTLVINFLN